MAFAQGELVKGTEVYYVTVSDYRGTLAKLGFWSGVVVGGGDVQVIIEWNSNRWDRKQRESRSHAETRYSPTAELAWRDAAERLEHRQAAARKELLKADEALYQARTWVASFAPMNSIT